MQRRTNFAELENQLLRKYEKKNGYQYLFQSMKEHQFSFEMVY